MATVTIDYVAEFQKNKAQIAELEAAIADFENVKADYENQILTLNNTIEGLNSDLTKKDMELKEMKEVNYNLFMQGYKGNTEKDTRLDDNDVVSVSELVNMIEKEG